MIERDYQLNILSSILFQFKLNHWVVVKKDGPGANLPDRTPMEGILE